MSSNAAPASLTNAEGGLWKQLFGTCCPKLYSPHPKVTSRRTMLAINSFLMAAPLDSCKRSVRAQRHCKCDITLKLPENPSKRVEPVLSLLSEISSGQGRAQEWHG